MGMYSSFNYEDIKVTDKQGLFDWLMSIKDDERFPKFMYEDFLVNTIDGKQFTFESWDNIKLISYWYNYQVRFLEKISEFIEGEVYWEFENNDESAWVEFRSGNTIFHIGNMRYTTHTAKDLLREDGI